MADAFKDQDYVNIQPGDLNMPLQFKFNPCSATTANDGVIPYGSTLASSTVWGYTEQGVNISTNLIIARALSSNIVTTYLRHSSSFGDGIYKLTLQNTFSLTGSTKIMTRQYDFNRIFIGDI